MESSEPSNIDSNMSAEQLAEWFISKNFDPEKLQNAVNI